MLRESWVDLRTQDLKVVGMKNYRITVRQLESLIRLAEAFAKFELASEVTAVHVEKAKLLL